MLLCAYVRWNDCITCFFHQSVLFWGRVGLCAATFETETCEGNRCRAMICTLYWCYYLPHSPHIICQNLSLMLCQHLRSQQWRLLPLWNVACSWEWPWEFHQCTEVGIPLQNVQSAKHKRGTTRVHRAQRLSLVYVLHFKPFAITALSAKTCKRLLYCQGPFACGLDCNSYTPSFSIEGDRCCTH